MLMLREEHLQVRDMVRRFAEEVVAPRARELDETETFPHEAVRQMAELGLLGLPYPGGPEIMKADGWPYHSIGRVTGYPV